jgi:hypothetical protein
MIYKYVYTTQEERQQVLNNNQHLHWLEEQNITEGNFLIFSDAPPVFNEPKPTYEELENQLLLMTDNTIGGGIL